jgi:hypothetical protein
LIKRLDDVSTVQRKGETALLSLLMAGTDSKQEPIAAAAAIVDALRQAGFAAEAQTFAREVLAGLEMP